jgi:hypothetical protein
MGASLTLLLRFNDHGEDFLEQIITRLNIYLDLSEIYEGKLENKVPYFIATK